MEIFRVPSRTIRARVALEDGRELQGRLYVSASGPGGHPGRLLDRLNDDAERFIPLTLEAERGLLLHKSWIRTVRFDPVDEPHDPDVDEIDNDPQASIVAVRVTLSGGELIRGRFRYVMPPDRGRLLDFLNEASRFVSLRGPRDVVLINRDYVVCVAGLEER